MSWVTCTLVNNKEIDVNTRNICKLMSGGSTTVMHYIDGSVDVIRGSISETRSLISQAEEVR